MRNELLVLFSMTISGLIVFGYEKLKMLKADKENKDTEMCFSRFEYLKTMALNGVIKKEILDLDTIEDTKLTTGKRRKSVVCLNNKEYTEKMSWFVFDDNKIWIVGKNEDFLIEIRSQNFNL